MEEYCGGWEKQYLKGISQLYTLFFISCIGELHWLLKQKYIYAQRGACYEC